MKKFISIFLTLLFLILPLSVWAQDNSSVSAQLMKVDHVANLRDRIVERIQLFFKFNPNDSEQYQSQLAEKRLAELKYVIDNGNWDPVEEMSSRYSTYLGRLTEFVLSHKMVSKKDELLKEYQLQEQVINELVKNTEYNSSYWLLLNHDINANKIYQQQIQDLN